MSDETRARMLYALMRGPLAVRDLAIVVAASESTVSHHLRSLRDRRLVSATRDGKVIRYSLTGEHLKALFREAEHHADHLRQGLPDHPSSRAVRRTADRTLDTLMNDGLIAGTFREPRRN